MTLNGHHRRVLPHG